LGDDLAGVLRNSNIRGGSSADRLGDRDDREQPPLGGLL
jgi:hypothetical protein